MFKKYVPATNNSAIKAKKRIFKPIHPLCTSSATQGNSKLNRLRFAPANSSLLLSTALQPEFFPPSLPSDALPDNCSAPSLQVTFPTSRCVLSASSLAHRLGLRRSLPRRAMPGWGPTRRLTHPSVRSVAAPLPPLPDHDAAVPARAKPRAQRISSPSGDANGVQFPAAALMSTSQCLSTGHNAAN